MFTNRTTERRRSDLYIVRRKNRKRNVLMNVEGPFDSFIVYTITTELEGWRALLSFHEGLLEIFQLKIVYGNMSVHGKRYCRRYTATAKF